MANIKLIALYTIIFCSQTLSTDYEITLDRLETAFGDDDQVFVFDSLRIKKYNRTSFTINGVFTVKQDLGEDIDIYVMALNFQGNQYKKIGDKNIKNFCSTVYMDNHQELFEDYQSHTSNPVPWKTCPYPKGSNEVKNFLLKDSASLLPPYIPGGEKWKIEVRFFRGEAELGGYNIYGLLRSNASLLG